MQMAQHKVSIATLLPDRDRTFKLRLKAFGGQYPDPLALNLAIVAEGHDFIRALARANAGREAVADRQVGADGFKAWDPTILKVDKDTENAYRERLEQSGKNVILLSEELHEPLHLNAGSGSPIYAVCDPFDGSFLFQHRIPAMWFSSLAFYDGDGQPLSCVVCDPVHGIFNYAAGPALVKGGSAHTAVLQGDTLADVKALTARYRIELRNRPEAVKPDPDNGSIESYALKPKKFEKPLRAQYGALLDQFKFFYPNGGPDGFGDVATGKIDVYLAPRQPHVDVFSGLALALYSGCQVADFDGKPVKFTPDVKTLHDVVVTSTPELMGKVLDVIKSCGGKPSKDIWGR